MKFLSKHKALKRFLEFIIVLSVTGCLNYASFDNLFFDALRVFFAANLFVISVILFARFYFADKD